MKKDAKGIMQFKKSLADRKEQGIEAQISEAGQILHGIEGVDSRRALRQVQDRIHGYKGSNRILEIFMRVAAILFVPLLVASVWLFSVHGSKLTVGGFATQEIFNPAGVRSEIVLPDGSKVWLNAESSIHYKVPFDSKTRTVKLKGEAFFDVKSEKNKPFRVESGDLNVTVLGTRFNFKAFPDDKEIEVVLVEGKVRLAQTGAEKYEGFVLSPGEIAVWDKMTKQTDISVANVEKHIGWFKGKLIFEECTLSEVARQLERWFGVEVKIADPEISGRKISTTFENESLYQILNLLELASPVKTTLLPAKFDEKSQTKSKERVIITSKK